MERFLIVERSRMSAAVEIPSRLAALGFIPTRPPRSRRSLARPARPFATHC